jgi:hypothetical protein
MNEYCDHGQCPAQARIKISTRCGPLYLCGHHFRGRSAALERFAIGACDLLTGLPAPKTGRLAWVTTLDGCRLGGSYLPDAPRASASDLRRRQLARAVMRPAGRPGHTR